MKNMKLYLAFGLVIAGFGGGNIAASTSGVYPALIKFFESEDNQRKIVDIMYELNGINTVDRAENIYSYDFVVPAIVSKLDPSTPTRYSPAEQKYVFNILSPLLLAKIAAQSKATAPSQPVQPAQPNVNEDSPELIKRR